MAGQHTIDVAIHHSGRQIKGDAPNGSSGIVAHPFQLFDFFEGIGEMPQRYNLLGSKVQVTGTTVIAQSLPFTQHFVLCSSGQILYRWPMVHKALPVLPTLFHLRLLEDDLRKPDGIRVVRLSPGQITTILTKPP